MRTPRICSLRKNDSLIQSPENIKHVKFKYIYSEDKGAVKRNKGGQSRVEVGAIAKETMWEMCLKWEHQLYSRLLEFR